MSARRLLEGEQIILGEELGQAGQSAASTTYSMPRPQRGPQNAFSRGRPYVSQIRRRPVRMVVR
jgi:hypothetical protein